MKSSLRIVAAALVVLALTGATTAIAAPDDHRPGPGKYQKYHDAESLAEAGYVLASPCVPGMGYHFANFALVDETFKVSDPEILVYANGPDGLELVGVEYVSSSPDEFHLLRTHSHPGPVGQAIHAWFFLPNPDGLTADFNPRIDVNCDIVA